MALDKIRYLLIFCFCWVAVVPPPADAQVTTLYRSVEQALDYSPQLQALTHNHEAVAYDLKQSRAGYRPSIDLLLGYGLEQHNDDVTRQIDADPANTDWDNREDATLRLTQRVYDGGETSQQIAIQKALLDVAHFRIKAATQAVALDAIIAHLGVYRQRELVALAEKNLKVHQDIYGLLAEREQAGAGDIADVTQTQARMARAQSNLFISKADLSRAVANYARVVGTEPGELAYAEAPETMPNSLEAALRRTEKGNPELLGFNANVIEADARVALARSPYKPKINIELSSRYKDKLEGARSWQNTNDAMLVLRWNLYKGGQDKAGENAALSRKYQSRSNRDDKLFELREAASAAWATYLSLGNQMKANQDATTHSHNTFNAYLKQFSVSKRSLLDVLSAENDYFQSASQLVTVTVNEIIAAYRILKLGGEVRIPRHSAAREYPEGLGRLAQAIVFPYTASAAYPELPAHASQVVTASPVQAPTVAEDNRAPTRKSSRTFPAERSPQYSIEIGPCINKRELAKADGLLRRRGLGFRQTSGTGTVKFIRLLEGVYPSGEARQRLEALKQSVSSAFVLPQDGQLALYAASFHESDRARRLTKSLEQKQIKVTAVAGEIKMQGTMLVVQPVARQTAEAIAEQMSGLELTAKVIKSVPDLMR